MDSGPVVRTHGARHIGRVEGNENGTDIGIGMESEAPGKHASGSFHSSCFVHSSSAPVRPTLLRV